MFGGAIFSQLSTSIKDPGQYSLSATLHRLILCATLHLARVYSEWQVWMYVHFMGVKIKSVVLVESHTGHTSHRRCLIGTLTWHMYLSVAL